jgi:hypothetical protein
MYTDTEAALDAVGEALVEARTLLADDHVLDLTDSSGRQRKEHDALIALAHATYDALSVWERDQLPTSPATATNPVTWRNLLEDLRVQVALAEMEARDAAKGVISAAEQGMSSLEDRITDSLRDMGEQVGAFRAQVRRITH